MTFKFQKLCGVLFSLFVVHSNMHAMQCPINVGVIDGDQLPLNDFSVDGAGVQRSQDAQFVLSVLQSVRHIPSNIIRQMSC